MRKIGGKIRRGVVNAGFRMAEAALAGVQTMLGTEPAFSENCRTHDFTGTSGDPGPNIRSGRITPAGPPTHTDLPPEDLERAALAHTRCLETMAP